MDKLPFEVPRGLRPLIEAVALLVGDADVESNARDRRIDLDCIDSSPKEPILTIGSVAVFGSREIKLLMSKDWRRGEGFYLRHFWQVVVNLTADGNNLCS
jgi:hypothetical protein